MVLRTLRCARVLCLWGAIGEAAAYQEWQNCGLPFPMPRKQAVRMLMEAALDMPALAPAPDRPPSTAKIIASRHNGALGGRPRNGETPAEARRRKLHMVDSEVIPAPDGQNATVITYATHPEQQKQFSGV
ncbi:prophage antirepressor [Acetobacter malorum DSM 14337]|uniref:Prophage antirepressor n=1 Tax=Acetobacter malorum DSM 14337 TaxID=1307910 RepID=A0ABQ0PTE4_9PROT|nr:hypothetical protein [Acetobacter malorum]GBQ80745.1 prophage antirepressor [Acetobacter malorum DSM 14337]